MRRQLFLMATGLLIIAGILFSPAPVGQCFSCKDKAKTCGDSAEVIEAVCRSQGGSVDHCLNQWQVFFNSCMWENGCNPYNY